ncbi:MAG: DsbA family protein [Polyangiaceae bacterium]
MTKEASDEEAPAGGDRKAKTAPGTEAARSEATSTGRRQLLLGLGVGLAAGAAGGFFAGKRSALPEKKPRPPLAPAKVAIEAWNPRKGATPALVTLVEFTDFQCPFCGRVNPTLNALLEKHPQEVGLVLRNRPLSFHEDARPAAIAFLAAARQDKGWALHDIMFDNRKDLQRDKLLGYAKELGLDMAKFEQDLDDPEVAAQVDADVEAAERAGAQGTPTIFVNGIGVRGARGADVFEPLVAAELAEAKKLVAGGMAPADVYVARCDANIKRFNDSGGKDAVV